MQYTSVQLTGKHVASRKNYAQSEEAAIFPLRYWYADLSGYSRGFYKGGADIDELKKTLGRGRAKKGMFEGDLIEGELEIGQVSAQINSIIPAADILKEFIESYNKTLSSLTKINAFK